MISIPTSRMEQKCMIFFLFYNKIQSFEIESRMLGT